MNLQEKHGWIGLHLQYPIKQVELNVSLTTLARELSIRKRYLVEKLSNKIQSLKSTDMPQIHILIQE